ncbi:zinc ABC transporter ATP-binding protein ZnuC [Maritimibacter sp. 55A14]|uniref:metal ABC transporter ATP-binding protein n=1 Tax=Maritimibacter sp. 55A14 TaxID=2174844 RepID=UPI000D61D96B|nr:metal ABC transporter ATP-binding protein [Maritimibacter sp. 55A14]PWE31321.1 zinc ABC transporter ATP-binding protein ZnuC [Maritimibacter sp. 55A14]
MSLIDAEGVTVRLGRMVVLRDVDFSIERGEIVTVVGPNGSGKSTLIRCLIGALRPARGRLRRAPGLRIGYVPQRLEVDRTMPVTVARFLDLPDRQPPAQVAAALDRVGLEGIGTRDMAQLSGGQFQRVLLARAILRRPDILVLDEPTQGLDQPGTAAFYQLIETLRAETGAAVLMVSHDLHVVMSASDRVICLNGHVCCEGTPTVVSEAPEYRALFGPGTGGTLALYRHEHDHSHGAAPQGEDAGDCRHDHSADEHSTNGRAP